MPHNTLGKRRWVEHLDEEHHFLATPSVLVLPSGRILVLFEKCVILLLRHFGIQGHLHPVHHLLLSAWPWHIDTCCGSCAPNGSRHLCRQPSWGVQDPSCRFKRVYASDDGGGSWQQVGTPGPLQWPQIFSTSTGRLTLDLLLLSFICKAISLIDNHPSVGVYIIGCQRLFSADNNLVISRVREQCDDTRLLLL